MLSQIAFTLGQTSFTLGEVMVTFLVIFLVLFIWFVIITMRNAKRRTLLEMMARERAQASEVRMNELIAAQNELTGRMQNMGESLTSKQGDMMRTVNERLDGMGGRLGQTISETTKNTQESLTKLQERLAVIDSAQNNITDLAGQVVELQNILSNKQTRGAFGEARMQQIVQDGLPMGAYEFQATLSNHTRPDCIILMPNDAPALVIDAKFPLEAWNRIRSSENPEQVKIAAQAFKQNVETHIKAISEKYLIKNETQDTAFMFVPSESIFAEIHENFEGLVQKAHRSRVVIVSPSLLMLSIQVMQSILKDVQMREQAHLIQEEVMNLMKDIKLLDDRVRKLSTHFTQAQGDIDKILISSGKIGKRGTKIADLDFDDKPAAPDIPAEPKLKAVE